MAVLSDAALAFDAVADQFDARFGEWQSVAAQRRAVREKLLAGFAPGANVIEIGGGTGEDAAWLAARGIHPLLTDAAPAMVARARVKLSPFGARAAVAAAETLDQFAERYLGEGGAPCDGAFSNFAALNCVEDLQPLARGLAQLVRPGGAVMLVLFGTFCPGEMLVEGLRGRPHAMLRRLRRGPVPARLGGHPFTVTYHRAGDIARAMQPWFLPAGRTGIGVCVPPSAAEPWISRHPGLLRRLENLDRVLAGPLAVLGDHVLYRFVRQA